MISERPGWMSEGACAGSTGVFFPELGDDTSEAKAVCDTCPVKQPCRDYSLSFGDDLLGIWGGLSVKGRRRERR